MEKRIKTEAEWRKSLSDAQFRVTRQSGTEPAFSSPLNGEKRSGLFHCVCCGAPLFLSSSKYDSGSGWPSFFASTNAEAVSEHGDSGLGMQRTEARCASCDAHLGHIFDDGPQPSGRRYCMNGLALRFAADE